MTTRAWLNTTCKGVLGPLTVNFLFSGKHSWTGEEALDGWECTTAVKHIRNLLLPSKSVEVLTDKLVPLISYVLQTQQLAANSEDITGRDFAGCRYLSSLLVQRMRVDLVGLERKLWMTGTVPCLSRDVLCNLSPLEGFGVC